MMIESLFIGIATLLFAVAVDAIISGVLLRRERKKNHVLRIDARVRDRYVAELEETRRQLHAAVEQTRGERSEEIDRLANERALVLRDNAIQGVGRMARTAVGARVAEVAVELRTGKLPGSMRAAHRLEQLAEELRGKVAANA